MAYAECKVLQALGQAGQRLVSRTGLGHQGEGRRGAGKVSAGVLDAAGLARLVLERARGRGSEAAALSVLARSSLGAPAGGIAGEHGGEGAVLRSLRVGQDETGR